MCHLLTNEEIQSMANRNVPVLKCFPWKLRGLLKMELLQASEPSWEADAICRKIVVLFIAPNFLDTMGIFVPRWCFKHSLFSVGSGRLCRETWTTHCFDQHRCSFHSKSSRGSPTDSIYAAICHIFKVNLWRRRHIMREWPELKSEGGLVQNSSRL